ncbi:UDP-4-amino-4,6-dideoxy-N-acetyl-beta-L-altrosamine transaminase [Candidatus Adlerbacteria bacterium RIFCSPHIGHO2_02_FULL_54_18]|uniref:UDP-4-amino-4, 6-dideoxy-N-acetyl-beta-L-altrosamine transaminase n=2 Tax=Candidatus Adleribacteriota TaxID=1752736 RepID=A0A1F4Y207_9BACT|nr:MAG: UDP-4-amino-4,6-dideoxy-N-acetyl-beta-L-altrosamine transaminase [Candidatus Adlerbacteria bacterium RIFCSPLOWO2_01_FULL_54_21b]OGC88007.1 MAG: UDP-4-amino-4,6-dideoxy-N-acetyl-beta-L-altrosamine transaminase [Candidatus Adlerbacteria bacterium RIFCSPHIGHO2_02_FULL_54_18]
MIPYSTQDISEADIQAVVKTLKSGWITQGPAIERFEVVLAKAAGTKYAVALNSGTAALHAAYFAAGVKKGDEVIVPALTFAATGNAALYLGARPVFADVDPETGNMRISDARKAITKKTKVLVPVDYAGRPVDLRAFKTLARKHTLVLIADAAQSLGARFRGRPAASGADMSIFSFHPVKSITTGEGGAVVTDNPEYARLVRLFRSHGITKDAGHLKNKKEGGWYMEQQALGYNYRMPDINAALGESQLRRLKSFITKRAAAARHYDTLLKNIPSLMLPAQDSVTNRSAWHLYPVRVDAKKRRAVFDYLRSRGIGVQVHHIPVHTHPHYQKLGYKKGSCPNAERFYATAISIPLFPRITLRQQQYIARELKKSLKI